MLSCCLIYKWFQLDNCFRGLKEKLKLFIESGIKISRPFCYISFI